MAAFTDHLRLCDIGVSLGDIHTLVYPRPKDGGIIRLSVGCEDVDDLLEDFELGLSFVAGHQAPEPKAGSRASSAAAAARAAPIVRSTRRTTSSSGGRYQSSLPSFRVPSTSVGSRR